MAANKSQDPETKIEEVHSMKLSMEIPFIRNLSYPASISLSYALPLFGAKPFSTAAPTSVPKACDCPLKGTFASYPFEATKSELYSALSTTELAIELHNMSAAQSKGLIGISKIPLKELIGSNATLEKTEQSAVRAYDAEAPVLNLEGQKIASIQFTAYLEDFGAVVVPEDSAAITDKENEPASANAQKSKEYEALWQLEMWKKAEEAKFNAYLKEKTALHLADVVRECKLKEERREKEFADATEVVRKLQQMMIKKTRELEKREQKLSTLEDELKKRIGEVTRQLGSKEDEIVTVKAKCKDEKVSLEKDKAVCSDQLSELKEKAAEINDKYDILKKELNETSMNSLKQEISAKGLQVIELEKKFEKSVQAKDLYKAQYEKIKEEIIRMREVVQASKEQELKRQADEIEKLRFQISMPQLPQRQIEEQLPLKSAKLPQATESARMSSKRETARRSDVLLHPYEYQEQIHTEPLAEGKGEVERLMNEKRELIENGLYNEGDEIIKTLNAQIAEAMKN